MSSSPPLPRQPQVLPATERSRMAAGAIFRDYDGCVLLVRPTYKPGWDIPGGMVEPGESPADACSREVCEELGIDRTPGRLLVVDWAPHPLEGDKVLWVFDGGVLPWALSGLSLPGEEIAELRWVQPHHLHQHTPDRLTRRLELALAALAGGQTLYAEHGCTLPAAAARS